MLKIKNGKNFQNLHHTVPKIRFKYSQKWNYVASFPIPTYMYLWAIYILPGSVCLVGCSTIGRPFLGIYKSLTYMYMNVKIERQNIIILCFGNNAAAQFQFFGIHKSEPTIILDSPPALHLQCRPAQKSWFYVLVDPQHWCNLYLRVWAERWRHTLPTHRRLCADRWSWAAAPPDTGIGRRILAGGLRLRRTFLKCQFNFFCNTGLENQ